MACLAKWHLQSMPRAPRLAAPIRAPRSPGLAARVVVGKQGRVVIPARIREALGVHEGVALVATVERGRLVWSSADAAEARLLARWARIKGSTAELIRERRAEARREAHK